MMTCDATGIIRFEMANVLELKGPVSEVGSNFYLPLFWPQLGAVFLEERQFSLS